MKFLIGLFPLLLFSCTEQLESSNNDIETLTKTFLVEQFVDSLSIGNRSKNKIELSLYKTTEDSSYVIIDFYSRHNKEWLRKNRYEFEKDSITGLDTELKDFNNDGFNDLTYISAIAARGANEVRRLFIYDKDQDQLTLMKISEHYPNLMYNKELDCIDAWLVYGGCSTVFLEISGDSLKQIASVDLFHGLSVSTYDDHGNSKQILEDSTYSGVHERFKNFSPLEVYDFTQLH